MKIKLEKVENAWRADCLDLPGAPPCGEGKTPEMALACLFYLMNFEKTKDDANWFQYIKKGPIYINEKIWEHPLHKTEKAQ